MANVAVVFAGGVGKRMKSSGVPKQFLTLSGKPILVYTLEIFQHNENIDAIVLVSVENWIEKCHELINKYKLDKVSAVVSGGSNSFLSIDRGLRTASSLYPSDSVVLIHDGVRPLIDDCVIDRCIDSVRKYGSAITVSPAKETIIINKGTVVDNILDRSILQVAKAPQCFILSDILKAHDDAIREGMNDFIDSASLMFYYNKELHTVEGPLDNIKITTFSDFYVFRAFLEARDNSEIFGV
ncbi:MAG TPA: 2-C-methyl-D-erythritol 4-phosphate cytidylyltransferase [Candidatus Ornithospirochaeta avicola]|uniref:2-C-methyl-D-erythritol 4-phosphate cytidylyltransferase n=1 Tax=Candidatus Ornithospirochaeta avicola TaxID=2840896 RepID=A0A9D1PSY5_9SPIO|nr:2-C-methyl-D-erythritol 4-phosphate cytidylyltransferase [Candidatus Ornithospirochaeta avicola]